MSSPINTPRTCPPIIRTYGKKTWKMSSANNQCLSFSTKSAEYVSFPNIIPSDFVPEVKEQSILRTNSEIGILSNSKRRNSQTCFQRKRVTYSSSETRDDPIFGNSFNQHHQKVSKTFLKRRHSCSAALSTQSDCGLKASNSMHGSKKKNKSKHTKLSQGQGGNISNTSTPVKVIPEKKQVALQNKEDTMNHELKLLKEHLEEVDKSTLSETEEINTPESRNIILHEDESHSSSNIALTLSQRESFPTTSHSNTNTPQSDNTPICTTLGYREYLLDMGQIGIESDITSNTITDLPEHIDLIFN
eukprot:Nk52_evm66s221 gene=Nk52_evmTU66s221